MNKKIWYYEKDGKAEGPISESELTDLIAKEEINENSLVWQKPMKEWAKASSIESLKEKFSDTPPPLPGIEKQTDKITLPIPEDTNPFSSANTTPISKNHIEEVLNQESEINGIPQVRPWHRLFAREVDYTIFGILFGLCIYWLAYSGIMNLNVSFVDEDSSDISLVYIVILYLVLLPVFTTLFWTFIEAYLISKYGTTLGKYIVGIRVVDSDGELLDYDSALNRSFNVWFKGMGMNIFIVNFIAMYMAYDRVKKRGVTSWDESGDYYVYHGRFNKNLAIFVLILYIIYWVFISDNSYLNPFFD